MLWTTADGKTSQLHELDTHHLISIQKLMWKKALALWRANGLGTINVWEDIYTDFLNTTYWPPRETIKEIATILKTRGVKTLPIEADFSQLPFYANHPQHNPPSLVNPKNEEPAQFDPKNKKLQEKVRQLKKERTPPPPHRNRDLLDY